MRPPAVPCVFILITNKWENYTQVLIFAQGESPDVPLRPEGTAWSLPCVGARGEAPVSLKKVVWAVRGPARGREGCACPLQQGAVASCPSVSGPASGTWSSGRMAARLRCRAWRGLGWREPCLLPVTLTRCHHRGHPRLQRATAASVGGPGPGTQCGGEGGSLISFSETPPAWSRPVFSAWSGGGVTSAFTGQLGQVLGTSLS